jgi:hypothetical protein
MKRGDEEMSHLSTLARRRFTAVAAVSAFAQVAAMVAALRAEAAPSVQSAITTAVGIDRTAASGPQQAALDVAPAAAVVTPVIACAALAGLDLTALDTSLSSAADVSRGGHAFCDVKGYLSPNTSSRSCCRRPPGVAITCSRVAVGSAGTST